MARIKLAFAMFIFGTIGIFVSYIPLPSAVIACARGIIGSIFLIAVMIIGKKKLHKKAIKKSLLLLVLSGTAIGFNWILLFEAYRYTGVAVATLCYYMAPVFAVLFSPVFLKEKVTGFRLVCTLAAVIGAGLISGANAGSTQNFTGIFMGLGAALLYAGIMIMNKFIKGLGDVEKTVFQVGTATVLMSIYTAFTEDIGTLSFNAATIMLLLTVGIVHTGIAYILFFAGVGKLPVQTSSVFTYIDPITAIVASALILSQPLTTVQIIGGVLILGSTLLAELVTAAKKS